MKINQELTQSKSDIIVKQPVLIDEALIQKKDSQEVFVAGGTLLQLHWESGTPLPHTLVDLSFLNQLKGITCQELGDTSKVKIGALTTIAECLSHPLMVKHAPLLVNACCNIAAPAVRNRATIGGNVASLVGDTIPALLALNAEVKLAIKEDIYVMSLWDWLKINQQQPFLLLEISIPFSPIGTKGFYRKVGRREAFIPSILTISGQWKKDDDGKLQFIRLGVGGGSHRPIRLEGVELILKGETLNKKFLYQTILDEFQSYSDPFISEAYRKKVAANILMTELATVLGEEG
ncbi:MAG TPA: FAD binding domain-containing protein [Metabacillus sp.]|nr:FAD binding domain-containing protein [Metabacillus sp.]